MMKLLNLTLTLTAFAACPAFAQSVTYEGMISPGNYLETPGKTYPDFDVSFHFEFVHSVRAKAQTSTGRYFDNDNGTWTEFCATRLLFPALGRVSGHVINRSNGLADGYNADVPLFPLDAEGDGTGPVNCRTKAIAPGPRSITVNGVLGRFRTGDNYIEIAVSAGIPPTSFNLKALGNDEYELEYLETAPAAATLAEYSVYDTAFHGHGLNSKSGKAVLPLSR